MANQKSNTSPKCNERLTIVQTIVGCINMVAIVDTNTQTPTEEEKKSNRNATRNDRS